MTMPDAAADAPPATPATPAPAVIAIPAGDTVMPAAARVANWFSFSEFNRPVFIWNSCQLPVASCQQIRKAKPTTRFLFLPTGNLGAKRPLATGYYYS
jgi:hypothetical protein